MRRNWRPFFGSVTVTPVFLRAASIWSGLRPGWAWSRRAAVAAATGQACDVPRKVERPPPIPAEVTGAPGASTSTLLSEFEKQVTRSAAVVASVQPKEMVPESFLYTAPTATALAMQAGTAICELDALFPVEANRSVPRARRVLMAVAKARVKEAPESQVPENRLASPRLRFTTFTSGRLLMMKSSPDRMLVLVPAPVRSSTLRATICASGAIPGGATRPSEVMMPATLVPWPWSSSALPGPDCEAEPLGQQPAPLGEVQKHCSAMRLSLMSAWWVSTPVSSTATTTPCPVTPDPRTWSARIRAALSARSA